MSRAGPFIIRPHSPGVVAAGGVSQGAARSRPRPDGPSGYGWALAVLVAFLLLVTAVTWVPVSRPRYRAVRASAAQVLLNVSDIPDPNWGEWSSGTNGSGSWRFFSVHTEVILATLNVTLWVEPDAAVAARAMDSVAHNVSYALQDGGVPGSDASLFWLFNFGQYGGMIVRRYNVVFLLAAHLESSFSLTPSDLSKWSGWQLAKIESYAATVPVP